MAERGRTHRLRSLSVQEVSGVDRPANRRKFLIVKQEGAQMLVDRGDGIMVELEKDGEKPDLGAIEAAVKEGLALAPDARSKIFDELSNAAKRLNALAAAVKAAPDGEAKAPTPGLAREIEIVARHLDSMVPVDGDGVEKAGRKISGARHAKLKEIAAAFSALLGELEALPSEDDADAGKAPAAKAAPADAPPVAKADEKLHEAVVALTRLVQGQQAQISKLATQTPTGNSQPAGERPAPSRSPVWQSDNLNKPIPDDERF